ncbi:MAG: FHA domain-containing protein [Kofleriaceae bacterium]
MPKKAFSDDDEKTTIEADQWGDEASTTVEQGEVADKMRALGFDAPPRRPQATTNVTRNTAAAVEESTVDEGNGQLVTPPILPPAQLVITGGNDTGLVTSIIAGKQYTIGRGLDNDIVLTDIAVSRKHFDLRNEAGSWVIVDRGSGNGTVVNGNLEDNPFMLANGDVIEIGNTTFRFDFIVAESPIPRGSQANGFDSDDDEMSTVAGKPLRSRASEPMIEEPLPSPRASFEAIDSIDVELATDSPALQRPATQPPPHLQGNSRSYSRPKTLPPPTPLRARTMSQPPAYPSTQPQGTPGPIPVPSSTLPMPQMTPAARPGIQSGPQSPTLLAAEPIRIDNIMPTTLPGQAVPPNNHAAMAATLYANAQVNGQYPQAQEIPPHSVHAQMIIAGQNKRGDLSTAHVQPIAYGSGPQPPQRYSSTQPMTQKTKYILALGGVVVVAAIVTLAIVKSGGSDKDKKPQPVATTGAGSATPQPKVTPITPTPPPPTQQAQQTPPPTPPVAQTPPPKQDPPKVDPPKVDPPKQVVAQTPPPKQDPPKQDPPKVDPPKQQPKQQPQQARVPQTVKKDPPPPKNDPPKQDPPKQRVAVADPSDRADALYREKKFQAAADLYKSAAGSADGDDATTYKRKASSLVAFGKAFNNGMVPGAKATEAFDNLVKAKNFDAQLGGHFKDDIEEKLRTVAPKAAISFSGSQEFEKAHTAVQTAEALGAGSDGNLKIVKDKLESAARQIYQDAMKEFDSNPSDAKEKLRRVEAIVDSKSPTYAKAKAKLLGQ